MGDMEEFQLITMNGEEYQLKSVDLNNTLSTETSSLIQYDDISKTVEKHINQIYVSGNGAPTTVIEDNDQHSVFVRNIVTDIVDLSMDVSEISQRLYDSKLSCKNIANATNLQCAQSMPNDVNASNCKGVDTDINLHGLSQCADGDSLETSVYSLKKKLYNEKSVVSNNKINNGRGIVITFVFASAFVVAAMMSRK
mgnify:CR=1 FL=1